MRERGPVNDAYPEDVLKRGGYQDRGCDITPQCLACPLPQCRYELGHGQARSRQRQTRIAPLLAQSLSPQDAADRLGISKRTVYRLRKP